MERLFVLILFVSMAQADVTPPEVSGECEELGYCTSIPNYPEEEANKIIEEVKDENVFHIDEIDEDEGIAQRVSGDSSAIVIKMCESKVKMIYPQAARDRDNRWHTIVNPQRNPVQGIRAEICTAAKQACTNMISVADGYRTECHQQYLYRQMVTIGPSGNRRVHQLMFPSCCSCVVVANTPF